MVEKILSLGEPTFIKKDLSSQFLWALRKAYLEIHNFCLFRMAAPAANPIVEPTSMVNFQSCLNHPTKILSSSFSQKFATNFLLFLAFCKKMLKMTISTSAWKEQHPNTGRNIQQTTI